MDITAVILTRNEAAHIARTIASARQVAEEIIVIDSGSSDNTLAIASGLGARVFTRALDDDFAAQRNFAAGKTTSDYLLHIDADERLTPELAANIRRAAAEGGGKIYAFRRRNVLFGRQIRYGPFGPDTVRRLYPREGALWQGRVHERLAGLPEEKLPGDLTHYPYDSWEQYLSKFNHYTTLWALQAYEQGKRSTPAQGLLHALSAFFKAAVLGRGILDGSLGLTMCYWHAMYTLMKYSKLCEKQNAAQRSAG